MSALARTIGTVSVNDLVGPTLATASLKRAAPCWDRGHPCPHTCVREHVTVLRFQGRSSLQIQLECCCGFSFRAKALIAGRHGTPSELLRWGPRDARGPSGVRLALLEVNANVSSTRSLALPVLIASAHFGRTSEIFRSVRLFSNPLYYC
jgi:hypothetical protein